MKYRCYLAGSSIAFETRESSKNILLMAKTNSGGHWRGAHGAPNLEKLRAIPERVISFQTVNEICQNALSNHEDLHYKISRISMHYANI